MSSAAPASSSLTLEVSARSGAEEAPRAASVTTDRPRAAQGSPGRPFGKRARIGVVALLLAHGGGAYGYSVRGIESTDNPQVDADVVAVPARATGVVMRVHFAENQ